MASRDVTLRRNNGGILDDLKPTTTWTQVEDKPTTFTPTAHTHVAADITDLKDQLKILYVYGKAQSNIIKGQAVQFAGVQGDHVLIKPAVPSEININPDYFIGLAESTLATNDFGYVIMQGELIGIDTSTNFNEGDVLWFASDGSVNGALTNVQPNNGYAKIQVGAVTKENLSDGIIQVRITFIGVKISDIVASGTPSSSTFLRGDGVWTDPTPANETFKNVTVANDAIGDVPLSVDGLTGTTANLQQWKVNGSVLAYISQYGQLFAPSLLNTASGNNSYFAPNTTGALIQRNVADANSALKVNQANASSTGSIVEFQAAGVTKSSVHKDGHLYTPSVRNMLTASNAMISLNATGVAVERNVADANTAFVVSQANASSTGSIAKFQFAGTNKALITYDGRLGVGIDSPTQQLHVRGSNPAMFLQDTGNSGTHIMFSKADSTTPTSKIAFHSTTADALQFYTGGVAGANARMTILTGGNIGVGTTAPGYLLDVAGNVNISTGSKYKINGVDLAASDVGAATSSHTHGNLLNAGSISATAAIATGDKLVLVDASDSSKITGSTIAFDTTDSVNYLRKDGTWATPPSSGTVISRLSTESISFNTTYADTGLSISLLANSYYQISFVGSWTRFPTTTSSAYRLALVVDNTTGTPNHYGSFQFSALDTSTAMTLKVIQGSASTSAGGTFTTMTTASATTTVTGAPIIGTFNIYTGTSAKVLKLQGSASVSTVDGIGLMSGASLVATKVG